MVASLPFGQMPAERPAAVVAPASSEFASAVPPVVLAPKPGVLLPTGSDVAAASLVSLFDVLLPTGSDVAAASLVSLSQPHFHERACLGSELVCCRPCLQPLLSRSQSLAMLLAFLALQGPLQPRLCARSSIGSMDVRSSDAQ